MARIRGTERKMIEVEVTTSDLIEAIADAFKVNKGWWFRDGKVYCEEWYGSHSSTEEVKGLKEKEINVLKAIAILKSCM